jgi:hypothetical protein
VDIYQARAPELRQALKPSQFDAAISTLLQCREAAISLRGVP